jgi:DNA (cytosine-5)-methyltransferase 1|tara:strand:+ start:87 stop:857 length:771 start_codon:yes stop_codon:yes gene_type:complete
MLQTLDLFAGIGGFALGLERTGGVKTVAFCEIEPYPRAVLAKHWPGVKQYDDVRALTGARLETDGISIDVITGGFPCQDISAAGKQAGIDETTRSGLWSEIARLVSEIRPRYVIVENVSALLSGPPERRGGWFGRVLGDLAEIGYDAEWHCIQAADVGAPHRRDRVWIVAYASCEQNWRIQQPRIQPNATSSCGSIIRAIAAGSYGWEPEPDVGRMANGVPDRSHRLKALGNAVVPKIPEMIGHAILEREKELCNQ